MGKYSELAGFIVNNVGGRENVQSLTHCVTRLRFKLKDENKANTDALKNNDGIVTVMKSGGQYQVVIGNHVPEVYKEVNDVLGININNTGAEKEETSGDKERKKFSLIDIISGIFAPVLGVLAATGMIKGILALLNYYGILTDTDGTYRLLYAAADCLFYFLPIFLGYTSAEKFGVNKYIGMVIGASLVYPDIAALSAGTSLGTAFPGTIIETEIFTKFMGIPVLLPSGGYASTVIPVILGVYVAGLFEKLFMKIIPSVIKTFIVPLLTVIITVPLLFMVVGPVANILASLIGAATTGLYDLSPIVAGALVAGFWQVLVIFGLHWGLIPIIMLNYTNYGYDKVLPGYFIPSFAQTAVVAAIMIKTKNKKLRSLSISSFISGIFGVTEPAIYGITLPRKKPFVISCIAAAIGGIIMAIAGTKTYFSGGLGVFGFPTFIDPATKDASGLVSCLIAVGVAVIIAFIATIILYKDDEEDITSKNTGDGAAKEETKDGADKITVTDGYSNIVAFSPVKGRALALENIPDEAFSGGLLGNGIGIEPSEGLVYAPADGEIVTLFPTNHAIGIKADNGMEILIHIGMNTVELDGRYFTPKVSVGDKIKKGQLIMEFDMKAIKNAGYSLITPVILSNSGDYRNVIPMAAGKPDKHTNVNTGDVIIEAVK